MTNVPHLRYKDLIRHLVEGAFELRREDAKSTIAAILNLEFSDVESAAILVSLARRGESSDELAGAVEAILERRPIIETGFPDAVDIGGTGGDRAGTFNISTVAALIAAGAGVPVIKHGNRSVTSRCGSSDLIAALGIDLARCSTPEHIRESLRRCNFAFVATAHVHRFPARVSQLRSELAIRSIFNLAGPLVHPARIRSQVIGVARSTFVSTVAEALIKLNREEAFVVHGVDGLDEVSCVGETTFAHVKHGGIRYFSACPEDFGVQRCHLEDLAGGDATRNAEICMKILRGESGHRTDAAIVAASALLVLSGKAATFFEGAQAARAAIDSGGAANVLQQLLESSR